MQQSLSLSATCYCAIGRNSKCSLISHITAWLNPWEGSFFLAKGWGLLQKAFQTKIMLLEIISCLCIFFSCCVLADSNSKTINLRKLRLWLRVVVPLIDIDFIDHQHKLDLLFYKYYYCSPNKGEKGSWLEYIYFSNSPVFDDQGIGIFPFHLLLISLILLQILSQTITRKSLFLYFNNQYGIELKTAKKQLALA